MEIILLKNVEKVGRKFEVVTVKNGYGRNYLIPQGLAIIANKVNRNSLDSYKRREASKLEKMLDHFREIAGKVKGQKLTISAKCGVSGKIFGSVTTVHLAKAMLDNLGVEIDRRDILLPENIKEIGNYSAALDLHPAVEASIEFDVVPDDAKVAAIIAENRAKAAEEARRDAQADAARAAREAAEKAEAAAASKASAKAAPVAEPAADAPAEEEAPAAIEAA